MPTLHAYNYAYIRVVPRIEQDEFFNTGVILFCRTKRFLDAHIELRHDLLATLGPHLDWARVESHLALIPRICAGEGPIGALVLDERFRWIVAPHNTIIQCGPTHTGLCQEPAHALAGLVATLRSPRASVAHATV